MYAGGTLVFSCERADLLDTPNGWRLLPSGRFAHTKEYVLRVAASAGYVITTYDEIVPRVERSAPVQGHLFVFIKE